MLRKGPLAGSVAELPKFPAPRSKEERSAALAAETESHRAASAPVMLPNPAFGAGEGTSPLPAFNFGSPAAVPGHNGGTGGAGKRRGEGFGQRRYAASRLGPYGAGAAAPGSGLRGGARLPLGGNTAAAATANGSASGTGGYVFRRFATGAGAGGPSSAGPTLQNRVNQPNGLPAGAGGGSSAGPTYRLGAGASSTPLAWTPMRATPGSAFCSRDGGPAPGSKRKAEDTQHHNTPLTEDHHGNVSILDAQRRLRQRSETGTISADRRSWRAGRTPYQPRAGSAFGVSGGGGLGTHGVRTRPASISPAPTFGGFAGTTPLGMATISVPQHQPTSIDGGVGLSSPGSKPITDTARKILETLNDLDQTMKKTRGAGAGSPGTADDKVAPSPPPTETLGSGLPGPSKAGKAEAGAHKRRVTFAELTGTPSAAPKPTAASTEEEEEDEDYIAEESEEEEDKIGGSEEEEESEEEIIVEEKKPISKKKPKIDFKKRLQEKKKAAATKSESPALPAFNFGGAGAPPLFSFTTAPAAAISTAAAAAATPGFGVGTTKTTSDQKQHQEKIEYTFGAKAKDAELNKNVKETIKAAASPALSTEQTPIFLFGKQKKAADTGNDVPTSLPVVKPDVLVEAKRIAEEAAKSPLPAVPGFSDEEEEEEEKAEETKKTKKKSEAPSGDAAVTTSGWDMSFLQKNQQTATAATEAAAKEIEGSSAGEGSKDEKKTAPVFSFGAPPATTAAAEPQAASFLAPSGTAAAAVPSFLAPAAPASAPAEAPVFNFGAAAAAAKQEEKKEEEPSPAPAALSSGWGDAFLKSNQAAATAATEAAAKEAEGGAGATKTTTASPAPVFSFGAPAGEAASSAAPAAPAFTFGAAAAAPATEAPTPAPFSFGSAASKPAETTPAAEPVASTPAFTFGAASGAAATATAAATPLAFGGAAVTTAPAATSQPSGFTFGASSTPATGAAFTFGAQQPASTSGAFTFGADGASSAAATSGFPTITSSSEPASAPSAAPFSFGTGAGAAAPAPSAAGATSFGFGAGAAGAPAAAAPPSTGFGFGAGAATPSAAPAPSPAAFAFGAQPAGQSPAPAATATGGFGFGAQGNAAPMENNNNGGGFGFNAGGGFGAPSAFGGAAAAAAPGSFGGATPPAFGAFGASAQPAFGTGGGTPGGFGAPQAPAFGAPAQQQPLGGSGFGFGAPQQQQSAPFGAPQPPPGQMIPNPFGGGAPAGAGGFSIGTAGNSQSEGRRKVKVRRPRGGR